MQLTNLSLLYDFKTDFLIIFFFTFSMKIRCQVDFICF